MSDVLNKINKYFWLYPRLRISAVVRRSYYNILFNIKKINFKTVPDIRGKFKIINNGSISFGEKLRFYSSFSSNPIGINKFCSVFVAKDASLVIGDNCGFSGVSIYCSKNISIGDNLFCGANVSIWDTDFHPLSYDDRRNNRDQLAVSKNITIGDDVFVGANSIILKGVNIGNRSVIGAGSVITKNIPPDEIWGGNPAKFLKHLKPD